MDYSLAELDGCYLRATDTMHSTLRICDCSTASGVKHTGKSSHPVFSLVNNFAAEPPCQTWELTSGNEKLVLHHRAQLSSNRGNSSSNSRQQQVMAPHPNDNV